MLVYQRVHLYLYLYPISICMPLYPNTFEPILTYQPGSGRESYWIARQLFTEVSISSRTFSIPRPSLAYGMYALRNEHWWWTVICAMVIKWIKCSKISPTNSWLLTLWIGAILNCGRFSPGLFFSERSSQLIFFCRSTTCEHCFSTAVVPYLVPFQKNP